MAHWMSMIASAALALVLAAGCVKVEAPKKAEAPKAEAAPAVATAPAEAPKPAVAPAVAPPPPAEGAKPAAEGDAPPPKPAEEAVPAADKDKLARAYQAVYCAQKKGEMDKILGIYKEFGFDTPQAFTKTWIEAAKDTDWVTKIAHEVGKKCP